MKLKDLLNYNDIVIQCHDELDADTIASGYALLKYLKKEGKSPRLVYTGKKKGIRNSLNELKKRFNIPLDYLDGLEEKAELLVTVDCRAGERNVSALPYRNLAVIDHHAVKAGETLPELCEIRTEENGYASCATVLWAMLKEAGYPVEKDDQLPTILYYGLYMDTQELKTARAKDYEMLADLVPDGSIVAELQGSNLSQEDIRVTGRAYGSLHINSQYHFAVAQVEPCDPEILGIVGDELMKVAGVNVSAAYCILKDKEGVKISVRCRRNSRYAANLIVDWLVRDMGRDGGGDSKKAAGRIPQTLLEEECAEDGWDDLSGAAGRLIYKKLTEYFEAPPKELRTGEYSPEKALEFCSGGTALYRKKQVPVGYVKAADLCKKGEKILIRMLEGDIRMEVSPDLYIMIGLDGEIYHTDESTLRKKYNLTNDPFSLDSESPWQPKIYHYAGMKPELLIPYAKTCFARPEKTIRASRLDCRLNVLTTWGNGEWHLGEAGDWLVSQEDIDPQDIYIVQNTIFQRTYEKAEERPLH